MRPSIARAIKGFAKRYGSKLLVRLEPHERMDEAIAREKQIKSGSRKDNLALIERDNPLWNDLYESLNASASLPRRPALRLALGERRIAAAPWIAAPRLLAMTVGPRRRSPVIARRDRKAPQPRHRGPPA